MDAKYTTSPPLPPSSKASITPPSEENASSSSTKTKRTRTKHACDECRRTQKKCDGAKPTCRRCRLNDTPCTYTPHKARRSCACIGPHDARRHKPLPGVCIFSGGHHSWTLARCAEHCVGYEYPPVIFSHDEWERSRPRVSPYQTPTVPSQRATERRRIASRMGYSESGLSDSSPPTIACPRIIPSPAQLSDSDTIFTIPSPASTLVDINSVHDSKSPLTMSSNGLLGPDERYPRDASSMAFATHVSPPSYEGNLHCGAQAETSFTGATTTLYLSNVIPDEHAYQISEKVGPHSSPDASYHLDFAGPSSYIPYVPDFQANPSFSDLPQMHTLSADVSQLPEEKQIPHFERQPAYLDNNFQVAAEYTREIPASRHSPVSFSSNEHIPPYASPVHANWQNEILAPHCHTTPGVHLTGAVYQQYESYGNSQ